MVQFSLFQTTNHMSATGLLKNCELDKTYERLPPAEAKFLTESMATFRNNKQALYGILVCSYNYQYTAKQHHYHAKLL